MIDQHSMAACVRRHVLLTQHALHGWRRHSDAGLFVKGLSTAISAKHGDLSVRCASAADVAALAKQHKGLLSLADGLPAVDSIETSKVPLAPDFRDNTIASSRAVFAALDQLPRPKLVACKSGRRARIAVAAWVAARNGGDADAAVEYLRGTGDVADDAPQREQWVRGAVAAHTVALSAPLIFRQLFEKESSTFTYLLADSVTREAILIDPVDLTAERDLAEVESYVTPGGEQGLRLVGAANTHCHADHITGTAILKQRVPGCTSIIGAAAGAKADRYVVGGDKIRFGSRWLEVIPTPGHTDGCVSFVLDDRSMVFSGDALLIKGCGRTDFQQGSSETLFSSVRHGIFTLPPECIVYPAHDYQGRTASSVREERLLNPRLGDGKTLDEFVEIMKKLNLPYPKKIDESLPANLLCGFPDEESWRAARK